ncbi:MAG: NAD(P)-binding domain-containing protein, partial [Spartobacteria bacterium]
MSADKSATSAVGVIGLGIIGSRVVANLRRTGHQVWLWNRTVRPEPN